MRMRPLVKLAVRVQALSVKDFPVPRRPFATGSWVFVEGLPASLTDIQCIDLQNAPRPLSYETIPLADLNDGRMLPRPNSVQARGATENSRSLA